MTEARAPGKDQEAVVRVPALPPALTTPTPTQRSEIMLLVITQDSGEADATFIQTKETHSRPRAPHVANKLPVYCTLSKSPDKASPSLSSQITAARATEVLDKSQNIKSLMLSVSCLPQIKST